MQYLMNIKLSANFSLKSSMFESNAISYEYQTTLFRIPCYKVFESNAISYEYQTYLRDIVVKNLFESNAISYEYQTNNRKRRK